MRYRKYRTEYKEIFQSLSTTMKVYYIKYRKVWLTAFFIFSGLTIIGYLNYGNNAVLRYWPEKDFTQESLDYFAVTLSINVTVLENDVSPDKFVKRYHQERNDNIYEIQVTLTNTGVHSFPGNGWAIFFCQVNELEPYERPSPEGLVKQEYNVRIFSHMGGVYSVEPIENFGDIHPRGKKFFRYFTKHSNVAKTDNFPNWYIAVNGLEPRIIESTRAEQFDWVSNYDTPTMWKRVSNVKDGDFDHYNPFTPVARFRKQNVVDMGKAPIPVIPSPAMVSNYDPTVTIIVLTGPWAIVTDKKLLKEARYLSEIWNAPVVPKLKAPPRNLVQFIDDLVEVAVNGRTLPTDESYSIRVKADTSTIEIRASTPTGAFRAIQTLLGLADAAGNIPKIEIKDAPRFEYRGVMIDVARNFQSKERILRYIDLMSMYKLNKLHLHLTDDEGWRLAIPGIPELTEIGAKRCHDTSETKCLLPFLGSGPFPSSSGTGYYTVEDYREILSYAAVHHIEVIPEIDMPGHSHAAIKALEARYRRLVNINVTEATRFLIQDSQDKSVSQSVQNFRQNAINPCLQSSYAFITKVIDALIAMHRNVNPLKIFHFGGDEVASGAWTKSPVCTKLIQSGIKTSLAEYLAIKVADMTSSQDLDLGGWEDGMMDGTRPMNRAMLKNRNVYAYTWNNVFEWGNSGRSYNFANSDYKLVMTPATNLYFDHPYEPDPEERGLYWAARYSDTHKVFSFIPNNLYWSLDTTRNGAKLPGCNPVGCPPLTKAENVAGIQGTLFGELLRSEEITDTMLLPRLLALAERAWHKAPWESESDTTKRVAMMVQDWTEFANTLGHKELARLDELGYKYRVPPPGAILENNSLQTSATFPGLTVEMSQDEGKSWKAVSSNPQAIDNGLPVVLRTRSALGNRYSRPITVQPGSK